MRQKGRIRKSTISTSSSCTKNYKKSRSRIRSIKFPLSRKPSRPIQVCFSEPSRCTLRSREWRGRMKVSSRNPNDSTISSNQWAFHLNCILCMLRKTKTTVAITKATNSTGKRMAQGFWSLPTMDFMRVNSTMMRCRVKECFTTMKKTSPTKVVLYLIQ